MQTAAAWEVKDMLKVEGEHQVNAMGMQGWYTITWTHVKHAKVEDIAGQHGTHQRQKKRRAMQRSSGTTVQNYSQITRPMSNSLSHGCPKIEYLTKGLPNSFPYIQWPQTVCTHIQCTHWSRLQMLLAVHWMVSKSCDQCSKMVLLWDILQPCTPFWWEQK